MQWITCCSLVLPNRKEAKFLWQQLKLSLWKPGHTLQMQALQEVAPELGHSIVKQQYIDGTDAGFLEQFGWTCLIRRKDVTMNTKLTFILWLNLSTLTMAASSWMTISSSTESEEPHRRLIACFYRRHHFAFISSFKTKLIVPPSIWTSLCICHVNLLSAFL